MRLIDADKLAHDLEYDVELCARALDDMNMIGKEREDTQFQKDCKQNCIWYISDQPTADAVPVVHGKWVKSGRWGRVYRCDQCGNYLDFDGVNVGRGDANEDQYFHSVLSPVLLLDKEDFIFI